MEFRHIKYFLTVAEEKNISRAAEVLGINQPPLSMQIRDLEREVGTMLFQRIARGVELTAAGHEFYKIAKDLPDVIERMKLAALSASRGDSGIIKVGFTASSIFNEFVTKCLRTFQCDNHNLSLVFDESGTNNLISAVLDGKLDMAFIRASKELGEEYDESLKLIPLLEEKLLMVLPEDHLLASQPFVRLEQLINERIILFSRHYSSQLYDLIQKMIDSNCTDCIIKNSAPQVSSLINLVAIGDGISLVPACMAAVSVKGVVFRPIFEDEAFAPISVIMKKHIKSAALNKMYHHIRSMLKY